MINEERLKPSHVSVYEEPPELGGKSITYSLSSQAFDHHSFERISTRKSSIADQRYLLIGFDTEFKTPSVALSREDIQAGFGKYRVLSYQFHAKTSEGDEWTAIHCPDNGERVTLAEFLLFALAKRPSHVLIPRLIFLVGHFTRADLPAFLDFASQAHFLSNIRNTFVSIDKHHDVEIKTSDDESFSLKVVIRDTMLLTPQSSKSLKGLGELLNLPKLTLDVDPLKHSEKIKAMDRVRQEDWQTFRAYALMDAEICLRYIDRMIEQYRLVTGKSKVPVTLTSIGIDLLLKTWAETQSIAYLELIGKERHKVQYFNKSKNRYITEYKDVAIEELHHYTDFITEGYHGGRNEQFWFGPAVEDDWIDIDLAGAYPTAMSFIRQPLWREVYETKDLSLFTAQTLGYLWVDFEFPPSCRYPCLPVRTDNGLIFPLKGRSYCAAPEIVVALNLGAAINVKRAIIIPTDPSNAIFTDFIEQCIAKREAAGSKTLEGLFWKEISNSTYGKTAQGLREKRVYDMRDRETKALPPSAITNCAFASFITSYVRALLAECMNRLPDSKVVFNCTTDGFLTNLVEGDVLNLTEGELGCLYAKARKHLTGDATVLDVKHRIRQPLGWRTRGQATLKHYEHLKHEEVGTLLAKGGIYTDSNIDTYYDRNQTIVNLFFTRTPTTEIHVETLTGVRDIVELDADLVAKDVVKRLSMEYDFKRQPYKALFDNEYQHLAFSTRAWQTVEEFKMVRALWEGYNKTTRHCLKTLKDFNAFADYVEIHSHDKTISSYLKKSDPDLHRLRQLLCSAWQQNRAGLKKGTPKTASDFAYLLTSIGVPCKRSDVENGAYRPFEENSCPATEQVLEKLDRLKDYLPRLIKHKFIANSINKSNVTIRPAVVESFF